MDRVLSSFVIAAGRAVDAGFGLIEMDMAHGYLLGSFLSPLTNQRADEYGGSVEHRLRFPLEVFRAVRLALPQSVPLAVRLNGTDWASGGVTPKEVLHIVRTLRDEGCDLFDVVSGWTTTGANPPYGPAWQVPMSDAIRNECGVRTMTSGFISTADEVNTILAAGRADLCLVSRRAWLAP
jgi:anthraniloyl-CoA monooxygenase